MPDEEGWFAGLATSDDEAAVRRIRSGTTTEPRNWPTIAVENGSVQDADTYRAWLREAAIDAAAAAVAEHERADDQQLIHAIRAIDDLARISNELDERITEWARTTSLPASAGTAAVADAEPNAVEAPIVELAGDTSALRDRRDDLVETVERRMHDLAPNLAALAGPLLGARLIALAGGLEDLAKLPSSTVQVLGAEDALFAHLRGDAPSPKHGIIFTHEYVRGTPSADRGSAARALAGKLAIAARIDHYAGDRRPELESDLDDRIATIRERSA